MMDTKTMRIVLLLLFLKSVTASWSILHNTNRQWVEKQVKAFDFKAFVEDVDANKDGIINNEECQNVVAKADVDNDGITRQCEWITFTWKNYNLSPLISQFIFTDQDGLFDFRKEFEVGMFNSDKDGKLDVFEFREKELAFIRRIANLAYEAINGPIADTVNEPQLTSDMLYKAISTYDKNENGYIDPLDFDFTNPQDRCSFVTSHAKTYGGTRWFWNYVFTLLDPERAEIFTEKSIRNCIVEADANKDGRTTIQEHTGLVAALFRKTRLFSGLSYEVALDCPGLDVNTDSVAVKIAADIDHDQDGVLTPKENLDHFLHFTDDNGDGLVQTSEFTDRLIRRYGIPTDLAIEIFNSLDINNDGVFDVSSECLWFSVDYNLDGFFTVCEGVRIWQDLIALGQKNLQSTLENCKMGSDKNKHTLWSEWVEQNKHRGQE